MYNPHRTVFGEKCEEITLKQWIFCSESRNCVTCMNVTGRSGFVTYLNVTVHSDVTYFEDGT